MELLRVFILASFVATVIPSSGLNSRKLEEGSLTPGMEKKCSGCSCNSLCVPPPPPSPKYHPPPSGDNGGSSSNYPNAPPINYPNAPPPPYQPYVYLPAPPGNLYTVNPYYTKNGASPGFGRFGFPAFIGSLMLCFLGLS